jgi:predicted RNA polymerase sigma factor
MTQRFDTVPAAMMRERKHEEIARTLDETFDGALVAIEAIEAAMDDDLGDDLLGLIFTACHPILSPDARAALTLRVVGHVIVYSTHQRVALTLVECSRRCGHDRRN